MSARAKKYLGFALKLLVTFGMLALLLQKTDQEAMLRALKGISAGSVLLCFGIMLFLTAVQTQRWRLVAALLDTKWTFLPAWKIVLTGSFFSQFLPTSIGGDVIRVWQCYRAGMPLSKAFNSVALERLMAVAALILIAVAGIPVFHALIADPIMRAALWLGVGGLTTILVLVVTVGRINIPARFTKFRLVHIFDRITSDAWLVFSTPKVVLKALLLSVCIQVAVSSVVWLLARDMGVEVDFVQCTVLVPIVILISMLPFSVAGWGLREGAMVVAFRLMGVDASLAVPVSVVFGLIVLATGVPGGILWLQNRRHPLSPPEAGHA